MLDKKNKIMYKPEDVYVGTIVCNTGDDGYYTTSPLPFIKITDREGNLKYKRLNKIGQFPEYSKNTINYLSVSDIFPLTELVPEEKHNQYMSEKIVNFYLLKYKLKNQFFKKNNTKDYQKIK